ncbi:MAG: type II secretion system F family protein [Candidatus Aenigmarchaeota archaeon]|nr:type II secretion system F family protein [Candidatus Aenigmarchaeota archaeon]
MFKLNFGKFLKRKSGEALEEANQENKARPKLGFLSLFRKKKKEEGKGIEYFKKEVRKQEKKRAIVQDRRKKLSFYLEKAGLSLDPRWLSKSIFNLCILVNLVISAFLIYHFSTTLGVTWTTILLSITAIWVFAFVLMLFLFWILFYVIVDLKIFKRRVDIEDVLPDYLQLTASNIKSGMTIDRALWYAVRPRFGVLAKEIETVAKETMKGEDLREALQKFADKYESVLLKRSISLLIEGLDAGGEIGDLLNKIAVNIQENKIMRREMAANVTTYVIFISFATVAAAPVLFALSGILIKVVSGIGGSLGGVTGAASSAGFGLSFSGTGIQYADFRIFAVVSLLITSFFSAVIIATIKKGSAKSGFRYIPIFAVITVSLFFIADKVLGKLLGVFF